MTNTTNFKLKKPSYTDGADIGSFNQNADIIDAELKKANDKITTHTSDTCHIQAGEREKWNAKAEKSVTAPYSLLASKWVGEKSPFSYKFEYEKITKTSNQELIPSESISMAELSALQSANLTDAGQNNGYFMLQANGEKPKIDIPIRIIFRGDM